MTLFLTALHVLVCIVIIVVVLLQRGKGAEIGAVFGGGGGSSTVFGSRGAGNFLTKITTGSAILFMVTSLSLAYFAEQSSHSTLFEEEAGAVEDTSPFAEPVDAVTEGDGDAFGEVDEEESFEEIPLEGPDSTDTEGTGETP